MNVVMLNIAYIDLKIIVHFLCVIYLDKCALHDKIYTEKSLHFFFEFDMKQILLDAQIMTLLCRKNFTNMKSVWMLLSLESHMMHNFCDIYLNVLIYFLLALLDLNQYSKTRL